MHSWLHQPTAQGAICTVHTLSRETGTTGSTAAHTPPNLPNLWTLGIAFLSCDMEAAAGLWSNESEPSRPFSLKSDYVWILSSASLCIPALGTAPGNELSFVSLLVSPRSVTRVTHHGKGLGGTGTWPCRWGQHAHFGS